MGKGEALGQHDCTEETVTKAAQFAYRVAWKTYKSHLQGGSAGGNGRRIEKNPRQQDRKGRCAVFDNPT